MGDAARLMYTAHHVIVYTRRAIIMMRAVRRVSTGFIRVAVITITVVHGGYEQTARSKQDSPCDSIGCGANRYFWRCDR